MILMNTDDSMAGLRALRQLMEDLRHPETGCPWDQRQTSQTIASHTLAETHELLDAIEREDLDNLREELGDLLFNIVFHSRIAEEQGHFDLDDVAKGIVEKMRRRHPHVFDAKPGESFTDEQLAAQWQAIKKSEKEGQTESCDPPIPGEDSASLSAIQRATRMQHEAAVFGFDWPDLMPVMDKLQEEAGELKEAVLSGDREHIAAELGDLMFVCINVARHLDIDPEMALRRTNQKFIRRFRYLYDSMRSEGLDIHESDLETMEAYWQKAKGIVG